MPRWKRLLKRSLLLLIGGLLLSFLACSPGYVIRAGWEEADILLRRQSIQKLIESEEVDGETKRKLGLVLEAREFAGELGLKPSGSFTKFTKIDRDVLVWVLTGSEKYALQPVTWWFPFVGSIPYKGFFDKEEAVEASEDLKKRGYDIYVRGSAAFSTLGWFNDPLLSTTLRYRDSDLVNTVIHEIFHNTIWVPNQVPFNETVANFIGSRGVHEFFLKKLGPNDTLTIEADSSWQDQLRYAHFLDEVNNKLKAIYDAGKKELDAAESDSEPTIRKEILRKREEVFAAAISEWEGLEPGLQTKRFRGAAAKLNNAVLLSQLIYFQTPWVLEDLYQVSGKSLKQTIAILKSLEEVKGFKEEPFRIIQEKVKLLRQQDTNISQSTL